MEQTIISGRRIKISVILVLLYMVITSDMFKETITFEKFGEYSALISVLIIVCGFLVADIADQYELI